MIEKSVKQSPVFSEFSPSDQNYHFDLKKEKVMAHVDTLYYSCFVYSDEYIKEAEDWLNDYPRRIFDYKTSAEMFEAELRKIGIKKII